LDAHALTELLAQAHAGSVEATGRLLETFRPYLLAIANQELDTDLRAKGGASDLVQDTFAEALRGINAFRGQSEREFLAWLRQILLHNIANFDRHFSAALKRRVALEVHLDNSSQRELKEGLASDVPSPSDLTVHKEDLRRVQAALEQMPSPYREVIVWRNIERLPFAQIARHLNQTEKNAQKVWARAIRALKKRLSCPS
jgi:RNA polymerase sigma-70 factor (ECF subfamily)